MSRLLTTEPYSLFSKMTITIWEKSGTSGAGVDVGRGVAVSVGDAVTEGKTVGGNGGRVATAIAGWQAKVRREAINITHTNCVEVFINPLYVLGEMF